MDRIKKTAAAIKALDPRFIEMAQQRLDRLTKPRGSLGRLEELARLVVAITGKENPILNDKVIFTIAGDHGIAEEGVSAYPKEVTSQMVYNFLKGGAGINVLARHVNARVVVVDMAVAKDLSPHPNLIIKKINYGTRNMLKGPAMTRPEAIKAVETGIDIFEDALKKGVDIVGTGDMGIGNTTSSSAIAAVFTKRPVEDVTGIGTGIDEAALKNKVRIIKEALRVNDPDPKDAMDVLAKVGGFEIGGLAGLILAAASKRIPVVIDGFISGAAALIAFHIEPKARDYMLASHCSAERGHKAILQHMGLRPILDLDLRLGEGTGAALGMSIVEAAVKILTEMATFKEANVSERTGS